MFVYARAIVCRIGLKWILLAALLLLVAGGAAGWLLLHKSPQQKIDQAEASYDQAMSVGAFPVASGAIRGALAVNENEPRLWLKLGRSELGAAAYQGALEAFSRVLDYEPENIEALQAVAELSAAGGNYEDAKDYADQLLRLQPGDVRGSIVEVAVATKERRFGDAERGIQALIDRGIATDDVYLLQSRARAAQDDLVGAVRILEARDKVTPGSPGILSELATLYERAGDQAGLRRARARLLAVAPGNVDFQLAAADDAASSGRVEEARNAVDQLQGGAIDNPDVQLKVIDYWRHRGDMQAALAAARRAVAGGGEATRIAVARRLIDLGQPGEALAVIQPITAQLGTRNGSGATTAWAVQGNALYALGRKDEALAIADRLLAYDETNNALLALRTRIGIDQRRYDQALIDAQLLVQNRPGVLEPMLLLARVQALRGDRALADVAYAKARSAFPDSITAVRQSVDYLAGQGRRDEASAVLSDFVKGHGAAPATARLVADVCRQTPLPGCRRPPA